MDMNRLILIKDQISYTLMYISYLSLYVEKITIWTTWYVLQNANKKLITEM